MRYGIPKQFTQGIGDLVRSFAVPGRSAADQSRDELNRAKVEEIAQTLLNKRQAVREMPMIASGLPMNQAQQLEDYYLTGSWGEPTTRPGQYHLDPGEYFDSADQANVMGMTQPKTEIQVPAGRPGFVTDDVMNRYNTGRMLAAATRAGNSNAQQIAMALGSLRDQQMIGDIMAGGVDPNLAAQAYAAVGGRPMYAQGQSGMGHLYTGQVDPTGRTDAAMLADLSKIQANEALAGQREAAGDYYRARAEGRGAGGSSVVQLLEYLQANGLSFQQSLAFYKFANQNPLAARAQLTKIIAERSPYPKPSGVDAWTQAGKLIEAATVPTWQNPDPGANPNPNPFAEWGGTPEDPLGFGLIPEQ